MKKIISSLLILVLVLSSISLSFAGSITTAGAGGASTVTLNIASPTFSVTVPTTLPASVSSEGVVTCADDVKIINNGVTGVKVTGVDVEEMNGWYITSYQDDFAGKRVGAKEVAISINGLESNENGKMKSFDSSLFPAMAASNAGTTDEMAIDYEVKVTSEKDAGVFEMMKVIFTIGWDEEVAEIGAPGLYNNGVFTSWDNLVSAGVIIESNLEGYTVIGTDIDMETGVNNSAEVLTGRLVVPEGVQVLNEYAFILCENLTEVVLPDSLLMIGPAAFAMCTSIEMVDIPDNVMLLGDSSFAACTNLNTIIIGSGVTEISNNAFAECTSLTTVHFVATLEWLSENCNVGSEGNDYFATAMQNTMSFGYVREN